MISKAELEAVVAPLLEPEGWELVELQVVPGRRQVQLRVFVDREGGIDVAECGRLSRRIAQALDERPEIVAGYRLEVSSPGMHRPIWTRQHFARFLGESVSGELVEPRNGQLRFRGRIGAVDGERIRIDQDEGEPLELTVDEIAQARLNLDPWKGRRTGRAASGSGTDGEQRT